MLNDNSVLRQNKGNDEILYTMYADSLRKRDAIFGYMEDGCDDVSLHERDVIIDRMKDNWNDVFLRMRDTSPGHMRDESETFLRVFRMNDELSEGVEDDSSRRCNDVDDISYVWIWICCKDDSEGREIVMRISSSGVEDEDTRATELGKSERS